MALTANYMGSDPELFVLDDKGEAFSAHIFEKKAKSLFVKDISAYSVRYTVKRDGAAIEVNHSPMYCRDYIVPSYHHALLHILKNTQDIGTLSFESSVVLNEESLTGEVPDDVSEFGCQPDFSAYTLQEKAPTLPDGDRRRFAGGHIHMSLGDKNLSRPNAWPKDEPNMSQAAAAVIMDYLAGLSSVAMIGAVHGKGEAERREFYGQAGSFRPKSYGIEYRTLGAKALFLHPAMMFIMLQCAKATAGRIGSSTDGIALVKEKLNLDQLDEMRTIIGSHDYESAQRMILSKQWADTARFFGLSDSNVLKVTQAVARAAAEGVTWSDSIKENWGLYASLVATYNTVSHRYWGPDFIATYQVDELIFPQYRFLDPAYKTKLGQGFFMRHPNNPDFAALGTRPLNARERTIFD